MLTIVIAGQLCLRLAMWGSILLYLRASRRVADKDQVA